jgi:hypothetical protein
MPYTLTIKIAAPGNAYVDKDGKQHASLPGHMWFSISANGKIGDAEDKSYGFAPIKSGAVSGKGRVTDDDRVYKGSYYERTLEITEAQYKKLLEFGEAAKTGDEKHFNLYYKDVRNNCVDFTWKALNHAGLHTLHKIPHALGLDIRDKDYEGALKPSRNVDDIRRIEAPFPKSKLNSEKLEPMSENRDWLQRLLSEEQPKNKRPEAFAKQEIQENAKSPAEVLSDRIVENLRKNPEFVAQLENHNKLKDLSA